MIAKKSLGTTADHHHYHHPYVSTLIQRFASLYSDMKKYEKTQQLYVKSFLRDDVS